MTAGSTRACGRSTLATVDHAVQHLLVTAGGDFVVAASTTRLTTVDVNGGTVAGSLDLGGIADLAPGGSGDAIIATCPR